MAWLALAVPLVQSAAQNIDTTNNKDPERFAQAQAWYNAAVQGDAKALCLLKYMGGLRGCAPGGCAGTAACGFATSTAKAYTEQLYQQALRVLSGSLTPAAPIPAAPSPSGAGQTAGQVLQTASEVTGAAATGLGYPPQPTAQSALNYVTGFAPLLLVGVGLVVLFVLVRGRQ